jgi:hypothetical protein
VFTFEGPKTSVKKLKFGEGRLDALKSYLEEEHQQALDERSGMIEKWKKWVKQADSRRKRPDAGPKDADIDMPLTRERMFQSGSRLQTPIFQQDPTMVAKPRKATSEDIAREIEYLMDYILDRADLHLVSDDWVEQMQIFPYGVVKTPFITEKKRIKRWKPINYEEYQGNLDSKADVTMTSREMTDGNKYFLEQEVEIDARTGCFPFVIPAEDFIFPSYAGSKPDYSAWVTHRLWLTKSDVKQRIREGIYDDKDENGDDVCEKLGQPQTEREKLLDTHKDEKIPSSKQFEIMETYLEFDVEGNDEPREIIVTWDKSSGMILRAVDNFYHNYERPFVVTQYKRIEGSMYGQPLTFFLEPLHVAYSASYNQRLDAGSKANEVAVLLPPGHPLLDTVDSEGSIRGGIYKNPGFTKEEIITFNVSQPWTQLPGLEQQLEHHADRVSHIPPTAYGEELAERPTAGGTMNIIEEGKQPTYIQLDRFRKSFAEVVKHMLSRYQQFFPEGLEYYVQSDVANEPEMRRAFFAWPAQALEEEVLIETKVSSSQMSKMARKQEAMALLERIPDVYETMMGMAQAAANPQNPGAVIAAKLLNGYQTTFDRFLTEFEIGKKEEMNPPNLMTEVQSAQLIAQNMQQMQQGLQQLQAQNQQLQQQLAAAFGQPVEGAATQGMAGGAPAQPAPQGPPGMAGGATPA